MPSSAFFLLQSSKFNLMQTLQANHAAMWFSKPLIFKCLAILKSVLSSSSFFKFICTFQRIEELVERSSDVSTCIRLVNFWDFLEFVLSNFASFEESSDILFLESSQINIFLLAFQFVQVLEEFSDSFKPFIDFESLSFSNDFDHVFQYSERFIISNLVVNPNLYYSRQINVAINFFIFFISLLILNVEKSSIITKDIFLINFLLYKQDSLVVHEVKQEMDSGGKKLREMQTIVLSDTIVTMASSAQHIAIGCLDDTITIWQNKFSPFPKQPWLSLGGSVTGILDLKFSGNAKKLASVSMDSIIKILDLETQQTISIDVPVMSAWKLVFVEQEIVTCGELGHIQFYNIETKEVTRKLQAGQIFFTSITATNDSSLLAAGNNNGELSISNLAKKGKLASFKVHQGLIRSLSFTEDSTKLVSGSDDTSIKIFDITSQKIVSSFNGHKQAVSCVRTHPTDNKILYSCSFDKSIRIWDLRLKSCIQNFQSGSALWAVQPINKYLLAGGQNGALSVFSVQ